MNNSPNDILYQYLRFATDVNRNLSNMIHLTNNLRYNTFQLINYQTNSHLLSNDIFFPSPLSSSPPLRPPPTIPRERRRRRSTRLVPRTPGVPFQNSVRTQIFPFLTQNQITTATEGFIYQDLSTNQLMCPITQQNFIPTDHVLRIRHCNHIFADEALRQWFRSSYECPVCRFDIRQSNPLSDASLASIMRDISRDIRSNVSTQTRDILDPSSNITDISNNPQGFEYSFSVGGFFT